MEQQVLTNSSDLTARKIIARTYLNENRLDEVVELYAALLRDYPEDVESMVILGNLYLAGGDHNTACTLYRKALQLEPGNKAIERQLLLAEAEGGNGQPEGIPTDPQAVSRLLQRLTGAKSDIDETELMRAANLLEIIIHSDSPADQVVKHLDEIDSLLPALVELNIRQARADGKPDLAEALAALKTNIVSNMELREASQPNFATVEPEPAFRGRVLMLRSGPEVLSERMQMAQQTLRALGCQVDEITEFKPTVVNRPDIAIAGNPHQSPKILEIIAALGASRIPVMVDLDDNFEDLPVSHPNYSITGLGTPARARAFKTALLLATQVTSNSEMVVSSLQSNGIPAALVPDGWSKENIQWRRQVAPRNQVHLGWIGSAGQLEDLSLVRRVIIRIIREFPNTQMVVIGDVQAYRLFDTLPENRRIYLPYVAEREFPNLLGQIDVLMVPVRNDPYHMSLPDTLAVQAGVKGIPWLASPIPSFTHWQAGGLTANTPDEWYLYLRQLVLDPRLRLSLGESGSVAARSREMGQVGKTWLRVIDQLLQSRETSSN